MTDLVPSEISGQYDESALTADIDAPVMLQEFNEGGVPPRAAAEQAMLASFIETPEPDYGFYREILQQYNELGVSPVVEGIRARAAERENRKAISDTFDALGEGKITQQELETILAGTPALTEDDIADLHREALTIQMGRQQARTMEEQIVLDQRMEELVRKGYSVNQAIQDRVDWVKSTMGGDIATMTAGIGADLLPFATTVGFRRAFRTVFPDAELSLTDLPRGELALRFREEFAKLPEDQKYAAATDFMNAIMADDGLLTGTDFQNLMLLEEALNPAAFEPGFAGVNWDRVIGNAITVLDAVALGGVAKHLFNGVKSIFKPGSVLSTVNTADPETAGKLAAEAVKKDMTDAVGMTPAEIVETLMVPNGWRQNIELLPPDVVKHFETREAARKTLLESTEGNPMLLRPEEQRVPAGFRKEVGSVGNAGYYASNFEARATDTGIEFAANYGRVQSDGTITTFKTAQEAAEHAAHNFPDARNITIMERTPKGQIKPTTFGKTGLKGKKKVGEYFYRIEGFKTYANTESFMNKIFFNDGDIIQAGPMAKWFFDPASRFARWMSEAFASAGDKSRGINFELQKIAKDFTDLPVSKKRDVVNLLQKYAENPAGMDMTKIAQLANHDKQVIDGFLSYRQTMDALYDLENRNLRNDLLAQGAKHLSVGDFQSMGMQVSRARMRQIVDDGGDAVEVFDPIKGEIVKLDGPQIEKLYAKGSSMYRVREPIGDLSRQTDMVMITKADQVRELPGNVLKKIDGYVPRHYQETYFIRQAVRGTKNGRSAQNFQILRAVGDLSDANQVVKQLEAEGKRGIEIIHDRSLTPAQRATINMDDAISLGRMFYHKRADAQLLGVDGLARVADPVEAMVRNMDSTSQYVSHQELLQTMKQRWLNTFGKKHGLTSGNRFPANRDEIGDTFQLLGPEKKQALEAWDHIRRAEGMMTKDKELWRNSFMSLAEGIVGTSTRETLFGRARAGVASVAQSIAENSLNKLARSFAFWHLIALNPARQLYVQSMQFHFLWALAGTDAPKLWLNGQRLAAAWQLKTVAPSVYKARKDVWAKKFGLSSKEFDDFVDQWERTGIPSSVDSHDYVRNTIATYSAGAGGNLIERGARRMSNVVMAPARVLKKIGFDQGELSNLASTFMLARRDYLKATGKKALKSRKDFEKVAANARNLALDMTHSGAFRYQDGGFSALMQFFQIQHKAGLAILGFNKGFTKSQRIKLAIGQFAVNGLTGLGVYALYRKARDAMGLQVPEYAEDFIAGGMHEVLLNQAISMADEDAVDLNLAEGIAPLGGLNAENFIEILLGNKSLLESFAVMNVANRWGDMAKTMYAMYQYPELRDDDAYFDMISNFASVTSGWNQVLRARAADRLGYHVTNSGSPSVQSAFSSAIAEGVLGISPRSMEEFYSMQDQFGSRIKLKTKLPDLSPETDEVARALYNQLTRTVTLFDEEFDPDIEGLNTNQLQRMQLQRMQTALRMKASILALYDPVERDRIWQRFSELASQEKEAGAPGLIKKISKMILKGDRSGASAEAIINRMRGSGMYDPKSKEGQVIEWNIQQIMESLNKTERYSEENMQKILGDFDG